MLNVNEKLTPRKVSMSRVLRNPGIISSRVHKKIMITRRNLRRNLTIHTVPSIDAQPESVVVFPIKLYEIKLLRSDNLLLDDVDHLVIEFINYHRLYLQLELVV